jgi:hypothetical protein
VVPVLRAVERPRRRIHFTGIRGTSDTTVSAS